MDTLKDSMKPLLLLSLSVCLFAGEDATKPAPKPVPVIPNEALADYFKAQFAASLAFNALQQSREQKALDEARKDVSAKAQVLQDKFCGAEFELYLPSITEAPVCREKPKPPAPAK